MSLTVVMPTRNQGGFIEEALRSVLEQRQSDGTAFPQGCCRLIVRDACSTDATPEILSRHRERLTWICRKDRGQSDAIRQTFLEECDRTDILTWLNSDDAWLPGTLERVLKAFEADPALDFLWGDCLEVDEAGRIQGPNLFTEDACRDRYLYSHNFICQPTLFLRSRLVKALPLLRENLHWTMDYEWFGRFFLAGLKGKRIEGFIAANRNHGETKTGTGGWQRYREILGVMAARPGPWMPLRRSTWIYTLEAVIKALENGGTGSGGRRWLLKRLHRMFLKLVAPHRREEIARAFREEIFSRGRTLEDLWKRETSSQSHGIPLTTLPS